MIITPNWQCHAKRRRYSWASAAVVVGTLPMIGIGSARAADCNVTITSATTIPSNTEVGCSTVTNQTASALNPGPATGADSANVSVTGATISQPAGSAPKDGIGATATGSGSATVSVTDTNVTNLKTTGPSLGINVAVGAANSTTTGNGSLNLSGTNNIQVGQLDPSTGQPTGAGGGTIVNARGMGNATTVGIGTLNISVYAGTTSFDPSQDDGMETTVRGGVATLNLAGLTGPSTLIVTGGNALLVDSLPSTPNQNGGTVIVTGISNALTVTENNTIFGNAASPIANAGLLALSFGTGTVTIQGTSATINTLGPLADGIHAISQRGAVSVNNAGNITTSGTSSHGIEATTVNTGYGSTIITVGTLPAVDTTAPTGDVSVTNSGAIITTGGGSATTASHGIYAWTQSVGTGAAGNITVANNAGGNITTSADFSDAILATSTNTSTGAAGGIAVSNAATLSASGASAYGIAAISTGASGGPVAITNSGAVTSQQTAGVFASATGGSSLTVTNAAGGSITGAEGVVLDGTFASSQINNAGTIGSPVDFAIDSRTLTGPLTINNESGGTINGFMTLGAGPNTMTNAGLWNLRNYNTGTNTLSVAVSDFGNSGTNSINNTGSLVLANVANANVNATGAYLPFGNTTNTPSTNGPAQGQILGVQTFTNSGVIDLGGNPAVGNTLVITGGHAPGTSGGGVYVSNGGTLVLNSVLNEGGANARSDVLVVDATQVGAGGATGIKINNIGGAGASTVADGIPVVEVLDKSASAAGAFALSGRAVAGPYEYLLFQGGEVANGGNPADGNWYLRSHEPTTEPEPPGITTPPRPLFRPEVPAYLANQRIASEWFVHSLHDRLGEPQYIEGQGFNPDDDKPRSGWLRIVGKWTGSHSKDDIFTADTDSVLIHGGFEVAKWKVFNDADRAHLGLMASYGYASTDAHAEANPYSAKGKVEGWSVGAYGTWYQNDEHKLGAYVDLWFQYGWFNNRVEGDLLPVVKYNSRGFAISGETGYAVPIRNDWVIEPQAQLIYLGYNQDDVTEPNSTQVTGANSHGWISRLGVRLHRTFVRDDDRKWQPYLTLNWWHSTASNTISFDGFPESNLYPSNRYEVKLGVNADLRKRWTGWANVSGAWGAQSFHQYALRVGMKYTW